MTRIRISRSLAAIILLLVTLTAGISRAAEGRPSTTELLPEKTLVYLRVADTQQLIAHYQQTAVGRLTGDPAIRPLIGDLYKSAGDAFRNVEDRLGLSLDELLHIPQGEICLALLPVKEARPALVAMVDVGRASPAVEKLLRRADELLGVRGMTRNIERLGGVELVSYTDEERGRQVAVFRRNGLLVVTTDVETSRTLLDRWDGETEKDDRSLARNERFAAIMARCRLGEERNPQVTFFVDPIELAYGVTEGNFTAQAALTFMPALGLDGVLGLGGGLTLAQDEFDYLFHVHLLLDKPRAGVLEMLALKPGDTAPENFVPRDVSSYSTINWNVEQTYVKLGALFDTFQGDGALEREVNARLSDPLGVDFKNEVLAALEGRFTWLTWVEPPARVNSTANLLAVQLRDPKKSRDTLLTIVGRLPGKMEQKTFGGVRYYLGEPRDPPRRPRDGNEDQDTGARELGRPELRRPQPCIALVDDYVLLADSEKLLQQAIAARGDAKLRLAGDPDYQSIAAKIARESGDKQPGMITFYRPEENLRLYYDIAAAEETRNRISARAEDNVFFRSLGSALSNHPLPAFEVLAKYLAPSGAMLSDDDTGLHYVRFSLRRVEEK